MPMATNCCLSTSGAGHLFCDYGHLDVRDGDYIVIPRSTMWRLESDGPMQLLMIEATGGSYLLPDKGMLGPHAIFDPAVLDLPAIDECFLAQQDEIGVGSADQKPRRTSARSFFHSIRWMRSAGKVTWPRCGSTGAISARC